MFPKPKLNLLLVRHGQTQANFEGRFYGRSDNPMTPTGHQQVQATAERLKDNTVSHVYSSPAIRAQQTAEILNKNWQAPLSIDERLWEMDHNRWEMLTAEEIQTKYPQDWADFVNGDTSKAHHGGETYSQVAERSMKFIEDVCANHPCEGETIVLAAHGGLLNIMLCEMLGAGNRGWWPFRFANAGAANVLYYEFGGVLLGFE